MVGKGHGGFDAPGSKFSAVSRVTGIVAFQSVPEVFRNPRIEVARERFAFKDIHVKEAHKPFDVPLIWLAES
jgi:hypothetical protein